MTPNYRAICVELIFIWNRSSNPDDLFENMAPLIDRARAALAAEPEPPDAGEVADLEANFRTWYQDTHDGEAYFGAMPLCVAIGWAQHLLQQATPPRPPVDDEVGEIVALLRGWVVDDDEHSPGIEPQFLARIADFLEHLAPQPVLKRLSDGEVMELVACLSDSLKAFCLTQQPSDYPMDHWSRRAAELLSRLAPQPVAEGLSDDDLLRCANIGTPCYDTKAWDRELRMMRTAIAADRARWGRQ